MIKKKNIFTQTSLFFLKKGIIKDEEGVAAIEFAFVLPILLTVLLGCIDLTYYLVAHQRIARSAYTMSNLMTQMDQGLSESQVSDMMLALNQVSSPFDISTDGIATVTAIIGTGPAGLPQTGLQVAWKRCYGNGTPDTTFGIRNSTVASTDIPTNTIVSTGQILVVTNVKYTFSPMLGFLPINGDIEYEAFFRPRRGTIANITPDGSTASACVTP